MPTTSMLKVRGLHTYNNFLSEIPEGALSIADNVNINRLSTLESRRGLTQYGDIGASSVDVAKQLLLYKDRVLAHYTASIAYDNGTGVFAAFGAAFTETSTGLRIKYVEANGNLYLTTSTGIRKISATSAATLSSAVVSNAGGIKAVGGTAKANFSTAGFFTAYSKVSYKIVWGTKDSNANLLLGSPSPPIEVVNQAAVSCTVDVTFDVPNSITTDYFYRIYRTDVFSDGTFIGIQKQTVNDEYRLVLEDPFVSGTSITINDILTEDFRQGGTPLYTNESSGEGILQANTAPPFATDISSYKNSTFFSNTRTKYSLLLQQLGTGDLKRFNAIGDTITIVSIVLSGSDTVVTFSANHGLIATQKVVFTNTGVGVLNGVQTIASKTNTTITITGVNPTGVVTAATSIYSSSIKVTKGVDINSYYFVGRADVDSITLPAYYGAINGDYFIIYSAADETAYVIYFHDTAGADTPPSNVETVDKIQIKVPVTVGYTATQVATAVKTAIGSNSYDFSISQLVDVLTITTANSGLATTPNIATTIPVVGIAKASLQLGDGENASLHYVRRSSIDSPSQRINDTSRSLCRVITSNVTGKITAYYISGPNDSPGKMQFESNDLDTIVFTVIASDSDTGGDFIADLTTAVSAENDAKPNRLYYSKTSQPESVPIVNYVDVGPQDKRIIRILGLRDSLFIIKEEGVYRLTGTDPSNFNVFLFDSSVNVTAADTCVVLDNQIFAMCSQGVVRISETGVDIISQPVQDVFDLTSSPRYAEYTTASFACAYVQDYAYIVWLPEAADDTTGTVAYRFSTKTQTWTSWTKTGNARCAVVNTNVNKLYVGPDDDNIVEIERKDIKRTDFADRQYELTLPLNSVTGTTITVSSAANITVGDVLLQQQLVTASIIIRLARKFALDNGIPNTIGNDNKDFYREFTIADGDSLQTKMSQLITQVNSDITAAFNTTYSTPIVTFQTEFNALIAVLNTDPVLLHTNYLPASQLIELEMTVTAVNKSLNQITTKVVPPVATGPIILYKAINCVAVFSPFFFGDPAPLKHVRDATLVFSSANLNGGTVGYNTDLSAAFEDIPFAMEGTGNFGYGAWSGIAWGGEGTARPFRTLVPRAKQRCRFIRTRFKHVSAFDEFRVIGISYTFEVNSERAYR